MQVLAEWDTKEDLEQSLTQTQGKLNQVIHNHVQKQRTTTYRDVTKHTTEASVILWSGSGWQVIESGHTNWPLFLKCCHMTQASMQSVKR